MSWATPSNNGNSDQWPVARLQISELATDNWPLATGHWLLFPEETK
jgi:hypothetical protein